jgi:hypothetical protein
MIEAYQQAVVFLSEALRFYYVGEEMVYRIGYNVEVRDVNITQFGELPIWKRIGNWGNFSRIALDAATNNGVVRTRHELNGYDVIYEIYGFMEMVNGLKVLKRIEGCRRLEPRRNQRRIQYGEHVLDPGFIELEEDYPEEAAIGKKKKVLFKLSLFSTIWRLGCGQGWLLSTPAACSVSHLIICVVFACTKTWRLGRVR